LGAALQEKELEEADKQQSNRKDDSELEVAIHQAPGITAGKETPSGRTIALDRSAKWAEWLGRVPLRPRLPQQLS
jgi:hypothetical protein